QGRWVTLEHDLGVVRAGGPVGEPVRPQPPWIADHYAAAGQGRNRLIVDRRHEEHGPGVCVLARPGRNLQASRPRDERGGRARVQRPAGTPQRDSTAAPPPRRRPPARRTSPARASAAPRPGGPRRNRLASSAPTGSAPNSAQYAKNLVLSQSQGWKTTKLGTRNHSQIGARCSPTPSGSTERQRNATAMAGTRMLVFLSQNRTGSSWFASHHTCGWTEAAPPPTIHSTAGSPNPMAGTKKPAHWIRREKSAQKAASATTVP